MISLKNTAYFNVTPILTLFYPINETAVVGQPKAQLTCLKAIDLNVGGNVTMRKSDAVSWPQNGSITVNLLLVALIALFLK